MLQRTTERNDVGSSRPEIDLALPADVRTVAADLAHDQSGEIVDSRADIGPTPADAAVDAKADTRIVCGDGIQSPGEACDRGAMNAANAYGPDQCTDRCSKAPHCGDGRKDGPEQCDLGDRNVANGYGAGVCTTECKTASVCGDGIRQGAEKCDEGNTGSTALGACDPECSGFYEKKRILGTAMQYPGDLGGIKGADQRCQTAFTDRGGTWKALIVGGDRRATKTPLKADGQLDWVIRKYRHYYNEIDELLWRTDEVPLLGVREGKRVSIYAKAFFDYRYPWSGYDTDWTTVVGDPHGGHSFAWTSADRASYGTFPTDDLSKAAGEPCDREMPLLCVEQ